MGDLEVDVAAVVAFGGGDCFVAEKDFGGEEAVGHRDLAARPGTEFVEGFLGLPAEVAHPDAEAAPDVGVAIERAAVLPEQVGFLSGEGELDVGREVLPSVELAAKGEFEGAIFAAVLEVEMRGVVVGHEPFRPADADLRAAESKTNGEPDGKVGIEIVTLELIQGGKGFGDQRIGGGVVFVFGDFVEERFGGEIFKVGQMEAGGAIGFQERFGEDAAGLDEDGVGGAIGGFGLLRGLFLGAMKGVGFEFADEFGVEHGGGEGADLVQLIGGEGAGVEAIGIGQEMGAEDDVAEGVDVALDGGGVGDLLNGADVF